MARKKIHEKKPNNKIKGKVPVSFREQEISQKTPENYNIESFELPPPRERREIPKNEMKPPLCHGSFGKNKKESFKSNPPPVKYEPVFYDTKSPRKKGVIPKGSRKKSTLDKKTPVSTQVSRIEPIPRSTGVVHSKKAFSRTVNQPPPKIIEKSPRNAPIQHPINGARKLQKSTVNKPPPKIHKKTPAKKKIIPPPIFDDMKTKIPKTELKTKKPK